MFPQNWSVGTNSMLVFLFRRILFCFVVLHQKMLFRHPLAAFTKTKVSLLEGGGLRAILHVSTGHMWAYFPAAVISRIPYVRIVEGIFKSICNYSDYFLFNVDMKHEIK